MRVLFKNRKKLISNLKISVLFIFTFLFIFQVNLVKASEFNSFGIKSESVISLVNLERIKQGKSYLKENEILNLVAQSKLNNMIENDYFAHTSPKGIDPWEWFSRAGYRFEYAGENLATNFSTAKGQHQAWMESPTHRRNILDSKFTDIGVAVGKKYTEEEFVFVTVQVFGTPEEVALSSPNFTPQTFEVPEELFYENIENKEKLELNYSHDKRDDLVAGISKNQSLDEQIIVKLSAWLVLISVTFLVIGMEYKLFLKKYRREVLGVV
ncbi:MAG: hypothetical protein KAT32_04730 [Candidatus Moranbacteria bacterium]|nr:hypothetical protein [Candidatus Moranbacteria bacterium]